MKARGRTLRGAAALAGALLLTAGLLPGGLLAGVAGAAPAAVRSSGPGKADPAPRLISLTGSYAVHVLLSGDSIALTLGDGLGDGSQAWGVQLTNYAFPGCDLDWRSTVNFQDSFGRENTVLTPQGCAGWPVKFQRDVERLNPDVVALELGRWEVDNRLMNGHWTSIGLPQWDNRFVQLLSRAVRILSSRGARVVLFTLPYIAQTTKAPDGTPWDVNQPWRTDDFNALVRRVAAAFPGVATVIDLNALVDPGGTYTSYVDGVRVRDTDDEHFSLAGGHWLQSLILPRLVALGRAHDAARHGVAASRLAPAARPGSLSSELRSPTTPRS